MESNFKEVLNNILFVDLETIPCVDDYEKLSPAFKLLWDKKASQLNKKELNALPSHLLWERAGIYSEFGRIIVIGMGFIVFNSENIPTLRIKALYGNDEKDLLQSFKRILEVNFNQDKLKLCAHNGKEFDFPYLCRRMVVNQIQLPKILCISGKKPWEIPHIDTMEMWIFGDKKAFTSLQLLATLFNITSSKDIMDGSDVSHVYYKENNLEKIANYCLKDVIVTAQLFLKMNFINTIELHNIIVSD